MAFCKACRTNAAAESALLSRPCICCGSMDYIIPGISPLDLCEYCINHGRWEGAKAALISAGLDPASFNERYTDIMSKAECAAWVEYLEMLAIPKAALHSKLSERYDDLIADWYCEIYLGGYDQRWQTSAREKANGQTG